MFGAFETNPRTLGKDALRQYLTHVGVHTNLHRSSGPSQSGNIKKNWTWLHVPSFLPIGIPLLQPPFSQDCKNALGYLVMPTHAYIAFEGPIASGKTTHATLLAKQLGSALLLEGFPGNESLADFYGDKERWGLDRGDAIATPLTESVQIGVYRAIHFDLGGTGTHSQDLSNSL